MAFLAGTLWLLNRPYEGIYHDARLYTLQALARLRPESLGQDIFLKFGSQDAFTIFSPVYAAVIGWIGVEHAARLLTLVGHLWWLAAASAIALRLLGRSRAWLAIALLAALPGYYGAWEVFQYAESFLTPRLFAEAVVLTSIALALYGRRWGSMASALLAMLLHPLIGMAGLLIVALLIVPRKNAPALVVALLGGLILAVSVAVFFPHYPLSIFDPEWLALIRARSPFLIMQDWNLGSWMGVGTSIAALWILGSSSEDGPGRRLFTSATVVACLGLVVTGVGASLFKVVIITQGQAWRWVWVACALAPIAAASGAPAAWRSGPLQRAALILLMCSWILVGWPALGLLIIAVVLWVARLRVSSMAARGIEAVCIAVGLASAYAWWTLSPNVAGADPSMSLGPPISFGRPALFGLQRLLANGVIGVLVVTATWWILKHTGRTAGALLIAGIVFATSAIAVAPDWLRAGYAVGPDSALRRWRDSIPVESEVFWPEDAAAAWLLLERKNYMSPDQTAGILFSRQAAMEMKQRAVELKLLLSPTLAFSASSMGKTWRATTGTVRRTCIKSAVDFIVVRRRLDLAYVPPPAFVKNRVTGISDPVYLYDCRPLRAVGGLMPAGPVP